MSFFYVRAWVDGSTIVAVETGEGPIAPTGDYENATIIDAVGDGAYVSAGTLLPTLSYENSVLSSTMVTLYPAKDVTSRFANADYTGQAVYNWADDNLYQWRGNPWGPSFLGRGEVVQIATETPAEAIASGIIEYDNFASDVTNVFDDIATRFDGIVADLGQVTDDTVALDAAVTTLQTDFSTLDGEVSANVSAISGLETRVTEAEGEITASASDITQLQTDLTNTQTNVSGNATAISGLDTRVTTAEGEITAQSSQLTSLESSLSALDGEVSGNATAISGLDTRVTDNEGEISAQSSQISSLSTTVNDNTTTVTQVSQSVDGIEGRYGVEIDNNGNITGYQLLSGAGGSAFNVRADQFAIFDSSNNGGDNPFTVFTSNRTINGVFYPAGTYIRNAFIDNAAIVSGSITNAKIGNLEVDSAKIANLTVETGKIANNAVTTFERSSYTGTTVYTPSAAQSTVGTTWITPGAGADVLIQFFFSVFHDGSTGDSSILRARLRYQGSTKVETRISISSSSPDPRVLYHSLTEPNSGGKYVTIELDDVGPGGSDPKIKYPQVVVWARKK